MKNFCFDVCPKKAGVKNGPGRGGLAPRVDDGKMWLDVIPIDARGIASPLE